MPRLSSLNLSHNQISSLPKFEGMSHLTRLDLSYNRFNHVPYCLANCPSLSYLNLSFNEIDRLPSWLASLEILEDVRLEGMPLLETDDKQSYKRTKQLLKVKLNNSSCNHEIKTVLTGPSEIGKAFFMTFFDNNCQKDGFECTQSENSNSLFIKRAYCSDSDELGNYKYNIWSIHNSSHTPGIIVPVEKLLYTKSAIFVIVFDTNLLKTEILKLWAWLDSISAQASPSCVLFVGYYSSEAQPLSLIDREKQSANITTELLPLVKHFSNSLIFHEAFFCLLEKQKDSGFQATSIESILQAMHQSAMLLECSDGQPYMGRLVQNTATTLKEEIDLLRKSRILPSFMLLTDFEVILSQLKNESINELKDIDSFVNGYLNDIGCVLNISNGSGGTPLLIIWNLNCLLRMFSKFFQSIEDDRSKHFLKSSIHFPPLIPEQYIWEKLFSLCMEDSLHLSSEDVSLSSQASTKRFSTIIEALISIFIEQKLLIPILVNPPSLFYLSPFHLNASQVDVIASEVPNIEAFYVKWKYLVKRVLCERQFIEIVEAILNEVILDNDAAVWLWKDAILLRDYDGNAIFISCSLFSITISALTFSPCFRLIKDIITKALSAYNAKVAVFCSKCLEEKSDLTAAEISLDHCVQLLHHSRENDLALYCGREHKIDVSQILPHAAVISSACDFNPKQSSASVIEAMMTSPNDQQQYKVLTFERSLKSESDFQTTQDESLLLQQYRYPCISSHHGILLDHCVVGSSDDLFPQARITYIHPVHGTMEDVLKSSFVSPLLLYRIAVQLAHALKVSPVLSNSLQDVHIWSINLKNALICSLIVENVYDSRLFSSMKRLSCWKQLVNKMIALAKSTLSKSLGMKFAVKYQILEEICSGFKQMGDLNEVISTLSKVEIQLLSNVYSIFNEKQFLFNSAHFVTRTLKQAETPPWSLNVSPETPRQSLTEIWVPMSCGPNSEMTLAIFELGSTTFKTYSALTVNSESILAVLVCEQYVLVSSLLSGNMSCVSIFDIESKAILHNIKLRSNACTCIAEYPILSNHVYLGTENGFILIFPNDIDLIKAESFQPLYKRISSTVVQVSSIAVFQSFLWVSTSDSCLYALECSNRETGDLLLKRKFQLENDVLSHLLISNDCGTLYFYGRKAVVFSSPSPQDLPEHFQSCFSLSEINQLVHFFSEDFYISSATEANGCLWVGLSTGHIFILYKDKLLYHMQPYSQPVSSLCSMNYKTTEPHEVCVMSSGRNIHPLFPTSISYTDHQGEGGVILLWNGPTPENLSQMILLENSAGCYLDSYQALSNMIHMGRFSDNIQIEFEQLLGCQYSDQSLLSTSKFHHNQMAQSTEERSSCWGSIELQLPSTDGSIRLSFSRRPTYQCLLEEVVATQGDRKPASIQLGYSLGQNEMLISLSNDAELDCYLSTNSQSPLILL